MEGRERTISTVWIFSKCSNSHGSKGNDLVLTAIGRTTFHMKRRHTLILRSGKGNGTPLQYSCLEKSHGQRSLVGCSPWVAKSRTWLSDFTFTFHFYALEKEMATHFSVLAWRILGMGSHTVGHYWSDLAASAAYLGQQDWQKIDMQSVLLSSWPSCPTMVGVPSIYCCIAKHFKALWFKEQVIIFHDSAGWQSLGDCSLLESQGCCQMAAETGIIWIPDWAGCP